MAEEPALSTRTFVLSEMSSRFYQERLAARNSGLLGFKHDLANQIFLFKALPELVEFSSSDELIEDLLVGIPPFLTFLERRLAPEWTDTLLIKETQGVEDLCAELSDWVAHGALPHHQWRVSCEDFDKEMINAEALTSLSMSTLGVRWSLTQLAWRIRRGEIKGASQNAMITLKLSPSPTFSGPTVGDCGQLLHSEPRLELSLVVEGWDLAGAMNGWHTGLGWCGQWSSAQSREANLDEHMAIWIGSWVNAAHLTHGVVCLDENKISIVC
jgi:hypothetical protein